MILKLLRQNTVKLPLKLFLFSFALVISGDESFSLTDYQIKKVCKKEKIESICIKNLRKKKYSLEKGNQIEIPVIPYKR